MEKQEVSESDEIYKVLISKQTVTQVNIVKSTLCTKQI